MITKVRELFSLPGVETGTNLPAVRSRRQAQVVYGPVPEPVSLDNYQDDDAGAEYYRQHSVIGMKLVAVAGGQFYSLTMPQLRYRLGQPMQQLARPDHRGGYYMYLTDNPLQLVQQLNNGGLVDTGPGLYGVLECRGYGPFVGYDEHGRTIPLEYMQHIKKISCSVLVPERYHGEFEFPGVTRTGGGRPSVTISQRRYYG